MALFANEARFFRFRVFFEVCSLHYEVGDPTFLVFLAKVDHYLSAWQVKKKSVRGNVWARMSLGSTSGKQTECFAAPVAKRGNIASKTNELRMRAMIN